jgi:hypothetical protein
MNKKVLRKIGKYALKICGLACYGLLMSRTSVSDDREVEECDNKGVAYSFAVRAILRSDMYGYQKKDAISQLKTNGCAEYYNAVIEIANDEDLYGYQKVDMIEMLSERY